MKLIKILLATLAISTATVATVAHADFDDYLKAKVYQDSNFDATIQKAIKILEAKGYQVGEIDIDTHFGKTVLEIEAYKNYQEYDIIMSYPDLKIISERPDW